MANTYLFLEGLNDEGDEPVQARTSAGASHVTRTARVSEELKLVLKLTRNTKRSFVPPTQRLHRQAQTSRSQRLTDEDKLRSKRKAPCIDVRCKSPITSHSPQLQPILEGRQCNAATVSAQCENMLKKTSKLAQQLEKNK